MTSKQSNTQANKKQAKRDELEKRRGIEKRGRMEKRANKMARVKWGRGKQEANGK